MAKLKLKKTRPWSGFLRKRNQIITIAIKRALLIKSIHLKREERLKDIQDKRAIAKRQKLDMTSRRKFE